MVVQLPDRILNFASQFAAHWNRSRDDMRNRADGDAGQFRDILNARQI
jgi:hypothetical protein